MEPREAVTQIQNTIFKPGWSLTAYELSDGDIAVTLLIHTVDTSYVDAAGNFFKKATVPVSKIINVGELDWEGLFYLLISMALEAELHEMREFMQIRGADGKFSAPLHPHTTTGEISWQRLGGSRGMLRDDNLALA